MSELSSRIRQRRVALGLSQEELADRMGYRSKSSITKLEKGINDLPRAKVEELAAALETSPAWLLGLEAPAVPPPPGFEPLPPMARVPLIGTAFCDGELLSDPNIERLTSVPAEWESNFALICPDDTMSPTIKKKDLVCIRCQSEVASGEIAVVRIKNELFLRHLHRQGDTIMLIADNAAICPPMIFTSSQQDTLQIEGRVVGFCRGF